MAKPAHTPRPGRSFVTTATYGRRPIFETTRIAELFIEILLHYRTLGHYKLHAYVVMPDHVHLLLTPTGKTLSETMNLIKGRFSRKITSAFPIWQRGFADHLVQSKPDFETRRNYIHQNPVRARLAEAPEHYPYSSATTP